ncbi:hypothetical protein [Halalkalicoccus jeotgali]|uniref:Uncharacterized protein n=1 Tax=Halalkalicoccus jeotgali (strain DSM 18796 / CECT 7217 / JCM 14584 / KCTC 4019 / B3) TaxID=795797 RepID=D8J4S3_HALJB|nr:hypothetical protein [Halalkalicoccus jeotgali]ADJ15540.1 hypothetical protein HacjB3_10785 [Halalkalicoccus jeotgali B3]ELY36051.1 hypothetical protein C497_11882 [Halalkalicoccus jeotgali B3]
MFRAILPEGDFDCASYEQTENGVELYTDEEELIAFVPYANLVAILNEEVDSVDDRSVF